MMRGSSCAATRRSRSPFERLRGLADSPWLGMLADAMILLRTAAAPAPVEAQLPRIR